MNLDDPPEKQLARFEPVSEESLRDWNERLRKLKEDLSRSAKSSMDRQRIRQARNTALSITRTLG